MNAFKIESNIPLPAKVDPEDQAFEVADEPTQDEPSRWVPFKPNQSKCANNKHWPMVGRCTKCGDVFPCPSGNCGHLDCADPSLSGLDCEGNGTAIPEWLTVDEPILKRAEGELEIIPSEAEVEGSHAS